MTQAIAQQSVAAPHNSRLKGNSQSGNTRTDEAAPRRAEKQANTRQAEAKASQVAKEVLDIKTVTDKAQEDQASKRIDVYA